MSQPDTQRDGKEEGHSDGQNELALEFVTCAVYLSEWKRCAHYPRGCVVRYFQQSRVIHRPFAGCMAGTNILPLAGRERLRHFGAGCVIVQGGDIDITDGCVCQDCAVSRDHGNACGGSVAEFTRNIL